MANDVLKGSERQPVKGARSLGKADPNERLEVTVLLRHRKGDALHERVKRLHQTSGPAEYLKREDFAQQFGADPDDMQAVKKFASEHGLTVVQESAPRRSMVLSGPVKAFNQALGVDLEQIEHDGGSNRSRKGPIRLPDELQGKVEGVFGLDDRQQAGPHFRSRLQGNVHWRATSNCFTPTQLASLYNFPAGTGRGSALGSSNSVAAIGPRTCRSIFPSWGSRSPRWRPFRLTTERTSHRRCERAGRRGDAGYRSCRRDRSCGADRRVFRAEYRPGISRRDHYRDS